MLVMQVALVQPSREEGTDLGKLLRLSTCFLKHL